MPILKLRELEHKIPRGMNFVFKVSLHDNLGNELSHNIEDFNGLRYELGNKDDVDVQIDNNLTFAVSVIKSYDCNAPSLPCQIVYFPFSK